MSLFENNQYVWRETYFVLFSDQNRPAASAVSDTLRELGRRYEIGDVRSDDQGRFEFVSMHSPYDFAAMDIAYINGDDVTSHVQKVQEELKSMTLTGDELRKAAKLSDCNSRFDIYHFEQVTEGDEDEMLDPGALLIVMEQLAALCDGIGIDPVSGALM